MTNIGKWVWAVTAVAFVLALPYISYTQPTNWVSDQAFVNAVNARLPPAIPPGCTSCSLQTDATSGTSMLWGPGIGGGGGVNKVNAGTGISVTGTTSSPIVNLANPTVPLSGTGATSFTQNGLLIGNGTNPITATTQGAAGTFAAGAGAGPPVFRAIASADLTFIGALATLGVGTGLTSSGGNLNMITPVTVALGGTQCGAPTVVASLPGSPVQGQICNVTDDSTGCVAGTTVVGTGAGKCQVTWTGAAWKPAGGATSAAAGGVTTVTGTAPVVSSGGASPAISITGAAAATANTGFMGPASGAAGNAAFRALVPSDVPGVTVTFANAGVTGTTVNTLTKLTGAPSTAVIAATTDTLGIIGITISGAGTTGSAIIQTGGLSTCQFDGSTTAGDFVQISTTTAGNCHDTGAATYPTVVGEVVGKATSTNAGAGPYGISLFGPDTVVSSASGAGTVQSSTATQAAYYSATGSAVVGNANVTMTTAGQETVTGLTNSCQGSVTLSGGTGTLTKACISSTSFPICIDTTTSTNPISSTPGAGSMTITGVGSDVIKCLIAG